MPDDVHPKNITVRLIQLHRVASMKNQFQYTVVIISCTPFFIYCRYKCISAQPHHAAHSHKIFFLTFHQIFVSPKNLQIKNVEPK